MLVTDYNRFVTETDQYRSSSLDERREIAIYGIAGEIGSLVSAIKKKLLSEDGLSTWNRPNDEIVWEIGDVIWYCFSFAQVTDKGSQFNVLVSDIAQLRREVNGKTRRAQRIRQALDTIDQSKKERFLEEAEHFPRTSQMTFDHYQALAYATARTEGRVLLEVCVAVLWQLGAELLRHTLPEMERRINKNVADRKPNQVLGEIFWHLAAIASLYSLSLDQVVAANVEKVGFRADRSKRTPLHDGTAHESEQFPRKFEVAFVSVGPGRSRMYMNGSQLGDPLTDNSYEDDGYRFHDVMHLANVAHLGWSPVVRKLMSRKRKRTGDRTDEVEDGARALLVEEVVLKAIHSEGKKLARDVGPMRPGEPERHFSERNQITFRLLRTLQDHVEGLEVHKNKFWEWEDAIFEGARVFHELRKEMQGTVTVDMEARSIAFSPEVCVDLKGVIAGIGTAQSTAVGDKPSAAREAILASLGFSKPTDQQMRDMQIKLLDGDKVCVKASGDVRSRMWALGVITFRLAFLEMGDRVTCTAIALSDL